MHGLPHCTLDIVKFAFCTTIDGVGVVAASSAAPSTYLTPRVKQHPRGTETMAVETTLPKVSTADGV